MLSLRSALGQQGPNPSHPLPQCLMLMLRGQALYTAPSPALAMLSRAAPQPVMLGGI